MYKHRVATGAEKGQYKPLYIDMTTPTKFQGQPKNATLPRSGSSTPAAARDAPQESSIAGGGGSGSGKAGRQAKVEAAAQAGSGWEQARRRRLQQRR